MKNKEHEIEVIDQVYSALLLDIGLFGEGVVMCSHCNSYHYFCLLLFQRLIEARRMMDKLRACIVANYYASAGLLKVGEVNSMLIEKLCAYLQSKTAKKTGPDF